MAGPTSKTPSTVEQAHQHDSITLTSVRNQWIEGLTLYTGFRQHSALATFKRLLRSLRSSLDERPSRTADDDADNNKAAYRVLLPEEVALLYINIALIHGYLGSYYLCATAFEEALLLDKTSGIAWFGLGIAKCYLRELGASKRAFARCLTCFTAEDEHGEKYQKKELTYTVWAGQPKAEKWDGAVEDSMESEDPFDTSADYKTVLVNMFPDGQWKLEWPRVEWNWRIATFERNFVRKEAKRPGDGLWGSNGIPAGVIFGPDIGSRINLNYTSRTSEDRSTFKCNESPSKNDSSLPKQARSRSSSLVKQKWSSLQQKLSRKKESIAAPGALLTSTTSSNLRTFATYPVDQARFTRDNSSELLPEQTSIHDIRTVGRRGSLPSNTPSTESRDYKPPEEELPYEDDEHALRDFRAKAEEARAFAVPMISSTRRSSLPPRCSMPAWRRLRNSFAQTNTALPQIGSIEEVTEEEEQKGEETIPSDLWPASHYANDEDNETNERSKEEACNASSYHGASPNISPLTRPTGDIALPTLLQDLTLETLPATTYVPPEPRTYNRNLSDSFNTDGISSLGSQMRSAMFPSLSSADQSRRPSYATDDQGPQPSSSSRPLSPPMVFSNAAHEEAYAALTGRRRPSSAFTTITSATPVTPGIVVTEDTDTRHSLVDPYYYTSYPGQQYASPVADSATDNKIDTAVSSEPQYPLFIEEKEMAVSPLHIWKKKERLSITGRTCLGEWEWAALYLQWRKTEGLDDYDNDRDEIIFGEDEDEDTGTEMLKPVRYEGS